MSTWWQIKSLIDRATSNDDKVTTGFMYNEINQLTNQSISVCQQVLDRLMSTLSSKYPIVKKKTLLVIKSCIERGHPNFRQELHQKVDQLREALNFSGPPDKFEGDAPYRRVREQAQEVMNVLFDSSSVAKRIEVSNMESMGGDDSDTLQHNVDISDTGSNIKLESMGNWTPPTKNKSVTQRVGEVASSTWNAIKSRVVKTETKEDNKETQFNLYKGPDRNFTSTGDISRLGQGLKWKDDNSTKQRRRGEAGGSWKNFDSKQKKRREKKKFNYNFEESQSKNTSSSDQQENENDQDEDSYDEAVEAYCVKLVDEITTPVGMRSTPQPSQLSLFVKKAHSLDGSIIASCVNEKLSKSNTKTILNGLHVIDALIDGKVKDVKQFFIENRDNLQLASQSTNQSISNKASNIINKLENKSNSATISSKKKQRKKKKKRTRKKAQSNKTQQTDNKNGNNLKATPTIQNGNNSPKPSNSNPDPLLGNLLNFDSNQQPQKSQIKQNSLLDDIKNLDVSNTKPPNPLFQQQVHSHPTNYIQQPVYYVPSNQNYHYQQQHQQQQQYHHHQIPQNNSTNLSYNNSNTLIPNGNGTSNPNNLSNMLQTNDSSNSKDSAFSFVNEAIKKEVN